MGIASLHPSYALEQMTPIRAFKSFGRELRIANDLFLFRGHQRQESLLICVLRCFGCFFLAVVGTPAVSRQKMNDTLLATVAKTRMLASMPPQWIRRSRRIAAVSPDCQALCWVSMR